MQLRTALAPGDLGEVVRLHGVLYAQEYGFDHTFEGYVAASLGEFATRYREPGAPGCLWLAEIDGRLLGCVAMVVTGPRTGQLRWFLVHPDARGQGLGRRLLAEAIAFASARDLRSLFLLTVGGLDAAAHLYREIGFRLTEEKPVQQWGHDLVEQRYDMRVAPRPDRLDR